MHYRFYAVNKQTFSQLETLIKHYNESVKKVFDKSTANRLQAIQEKNNYQKQIGDVLRDQLCIDSIEQSVYEEYVRPYIGEHLISEGKMCELAIQINSEDHILYQIIKRTMVEERQLCIWME